MRFCALLFATVTLLIGSASVSLEAQSQADAERLPPPAHGLGHVRGVQLCKRASINEVINSTLAEAE